MPQNKIPLEPDNYYHIYNHSNGFENIFIDTMDRKKFLEKYIKYISPIADTYAYCLLSNHFHLLLKIKSNKDLIKVLPFKGFQPLEEQMDLNQKEIVRKISYRFSHFFNSYAQSFNKKYKRMGGLFMSNFGRKLVDKERYFLKLIHYIHSNPLEHGFVGKISEWEYSSYQEIIKNDSMVIRVQEVIQSFGDLENFKFVHQQSFENKNFNL